MLKDKRFWMGVLVAWLLVSFVPTLSLHNVMRKGGMK